MSEVEQNFWHQIFTYTVTVSSLLQLLSGTPVCLKFIRKGNTGDASSLPFVVGAFNCVLWYRYGVIVKEATVQMSNMFGAVILGSYVFCFYKYTLKRINVLRQIVFGSVFLITLFYCMSIIRDRRGIEDERRTLGFIGSVITVIFCASPLASIGAVIRNQSTESLPFPLIFMTFVVNSQWWILGTIIQDSFIKIPNAMGCVIALIQLLLFVIYPAKSKKVSKSSSDYVQLSVII